jgi:hypothetical protein
MVKAHLFDLEARTVYWDALVHLLVLLVQQLQGAPPQLRAAFLHSPGGNTALQVLSIFSSEDDDPTCQVRFIVSQSLLASAAEDPTNQQQPIAEGGMQGHAVYGSELVEHLLLPGLLLQPVAVGGGVEGCNSSSSDNSGHGGGAEGCDDLRGSSGGPKNLEGSSESSDGLCSRWVCRWALCMYLVLSMYPCFDQESTVTGLADWSLLQIGPPSAAMQPLGCSLWSLY